MRRFASIFSTVVVVFALIQTPAQARGSDHKGSGLSFKWARPSGTTAPHLGGRPAPWHPIDAKAYERAKALANVRAAARSRHKQSGAATPSTVAGATSPVPGPSWEGESENDLTPPDPTGAVGPNSYIELINLRFGIYDRSGTLITDGTMSQLSNLPQSDLSDPQIAWDPASQHFYYVILDFANNTFGVGWSKTDNPTSTADFCKYVASFGYGSLILPDYPKLGLSQNFIMIGVNEFLLGLLYYGSDVDWISKPAAGPLTSCPDPGTFKLGSFKRLKNANRTSATTPVPAVQADAGDGWVVATPDVTTQTGTFLSVFRVRKNSLGNAQISKARSVPVPAYTLPASAPQPGTTAPIDTLDGRLERSVSAFDPRFGKTAVWTAHAVYGGAGSEERWYEIDPVAGTVLQSGAATDPTLYVWNGAVSPDRAVNSLGSAFGSNMVMGFNTSSPNDYPAIQMISKVGGAAQSGFVLVQASPGPNVDYSCFAPYGPPCRWGDYSGASPDPAADLGGSSGAVWLSGEWNVASSNDDDVDWRTWNWKALP